MPDTNPGASPQKTTFAGWPPIITVTGSRGCGVNGGVRASVVILPVTPAGAVCPSPVRNKATTLPFDAGLIGELALSSWFRIAPGPVPELLSVNSAGTVAAALSGNEFESWPRNVTWTDGSTS